MSISLTPLTTDLNAHQNLPAQPSLSSNELKVAWDKPVNDIKTYINSTMIPEVQTKVGSEIATNLQAAKNYTDSEIGALSFSAENISYDNTGTGLTADDVQGAVNELKSNEDSLGTRITDLESDTTPSKVTLTAASGSSITRQNVFTIGDVVFIQFSGTTSISSYGTKTLCTLPEGLRPSSTRYIQANGTDSDRNYGVFIDATISTDGTVKITNPHSMGINLFQVYGFYVKN